MVNRYLADNFALQEEVARQKVLFLTFEEWLIFLRKHNYEFSDLVIGVSDWAVSESKKEGDVNPSWKAVSSILLSAADKLQSLSSGECGRMAALPESTAAGSLQGYLRQQMMIEMVDLWMNDLWDARCRFSDFLKTLAKYAEVQVEESAESREIPTWEAVTGLMKAAADVSEHKGWELP